MKEKKDRTGTICQKKCKKINSTWVVILVITMNLIMIFECLYWVIIGFMRCCHRNLLLLNFFEGRKLYFYRGQSITKLNEKTINCLLSSLIKRQYEDNYIFGSFEVRNSKKKKHCSFQLQQKNSFFFLYIFFVKEHNK